MSRHNEFGKKGEEIARDYLELKGYMILAQNWRFRKAEVDIIAKKGPSLIFVEVKARSSENYGTPESFVTEKKQRLLSVAASAYMDKYNYDWEIRFDIISIVKESHHRHKIKHFEDAFFFGL